MFLYLLCTESKFIQRKFRVMVGWHSNFRNNGMLLIILNPIHCSVFTIISFCLISSFLCVCATHLYIFISFITSYNTGYAFVEVATKKVLRQNRWCTTANDENYAGMKIVKYLGLIAVLRTISFFLIFHSTIRTTEKLFNYMETLCLDIQANSNVFTTHIHVCWM